MSEVTLRFRKEIPRKHRGSADAKIQWLWNQRFGTIQTIYNETDDVETKTVCTLFLQAIIGKELPSIRLILNRLEGGAIVDTEIVERETDSPSGFMPF